MHLLFGDFGLPSHHVRRLFGVERVRDTPDNKHIDLHRPPPVFLLALRPIVVTQTRLSAFAARRRRRERRAGGRRQGRPARPVWVVERTAWARGPRHARVVAAVVVAGPAGGRHAPLVDADRRREPGRRDAVRPGDVVGVSATPGRGDGPRGGGHWHSGGGGGRDPRPARRCHLPDIFLFLAGRRVQHRVGSSVPGRSSVGSRQYELTAGADAGRGGVTQSTEQHHHRRQKIRQLLSASLPRGRMQNVDKPKSRERRRETRPTQTHTNRSREARGTLAHTGRGCRGSDGTLGGPVGGWVGAVGLAEAECAGDQ